MQEPDWPTKSRLCSLALLAARGVPLERFLSSFIFPGQLGAEPGLKH